MKINSENCEAWFLDYYEGNLSKEREEELFAFLALNPELHELFSSYDEVSFSPDKHIHFDWKQELKKPVGVHEGISESNYEEYFVSYVEGLLNADEKAVVEKFILQFPARRGEFEMLQNAILLPDEKIVFEHKESLRKSILVTPENFEELAIASMEGLLNAGEENAFAASMAVNTEQQKTYEAYQQTKLSPDTSIVFEDKELLKRKDRGAFWWLVDTRFAAAAAITLLMGIFYWNYSRNETITIKNDGFVAARDSGKSAPLIDPLTPESNKIANSTTTNSTTANKDVKAEVKNDVPVKKDLNPSVNPVAVKENKQIAEIYRTSGPGLLLNTNVNPQVDFSDTYYSTLHSGPASEPVAARTIVSARQAAMRWMKNKLDRTPAKNEQEDVYLAQENTSGNGNVSGFDLTSSAVSALGNATGANLRLGHETEGTVLTVGKYELLLNRNN
ncbi:MAG: hypothetical protein M3R17_08290 [Bacteroidota bacterium]|nr:hypothetical protein [Bacteroidota bacterium]